MAQRVVGLFAGSGQRGRDLVRREVARLQMRPDDAGHEPLVVFQLRHGGLLLALGVTALLHGGQYAGLFPFGHAAESHSCEQKKKTTVNGVH